MFVLADFQRVLSESKLTRSEVAQLYGVTRQAVHYWVTTAPPKATITGRMADTITRALLNALDRGALPMGSASKDVRRSRIKSMAAKLQSLKPAPVQ